jgi:iron complex transport system substrate-binding protein
LIRHGVQVTVFNQRSVDEIFSMLYQVAAMVGEAQQGLDRIAVWRAELDAMRARVLALQAQGARRPRVYFEEWDTPQISAIRWVSELMGIAGGDDIFPELALESLGKNRILADGDAVLRHAPDIIIGSWCGKKFRPETVAARPGWDALPAVRNGDVYEIKSPLILQPGPAALTDGLDALHHICAGWMERSIAPSRVRA